MGHEDIIGLADGVILTPAERAVLIEQAETLKVQCDGLIQSCQDSQGAKVILSFVSMLSTAEYISDVLKTKVKQVALRKQTG